MILQLANRSIRHPREIIEDVLVKVDKFFFPVEFVILHVDEDVKVPLMLGRPLLATSQALIDVSNGKMVLRVCDEEVAFKLLDAMNRSPNFDDSFFYLDIIDQVVDDCM